MEKFEINTDNIHVTDTGELKINNYTLNDLEQKLINYIVSKIDNKEIIDAVDIEIIKTLFENF